MSDRAQKLLESLKRYSFEALVINILLTTLLIIAVVTLYVRGSSDNAGAGATATSTQADTGTNSTIPSAEPQPTTISQPKPVEFKFSGTGQKTTEKFRLQPGLATIRTTNTAAKDLFTVYLLDSLGNEEDLVANQIGNADSSKSIQITEADDYVFNVDVSGGWTITVTQ